MNLDIKPSPIFTALAALALAFAIGSSAQAATYSFSGVIEDGALAGQSFGGQFSFDDSLLAGSPDYLEPTALSLLFNGQTYSLGTALAGSSGIAFDAGKPIGIDAVWGDDSKGVTLTSGFGSPYLADTAGNFGSVTISAAPVPEPASWMLGLAGLAAVGAVVRRKRAATLG